MAIEQFFTEETALVFTNGTVVKGSKEVSNAIMSCCRAYAGGYMKAAAPVILIAGGVIGAGTVIVVVAVQNEIRDKKIQNYIKRKLRK